MKKTKHTPGPWTIDNLEIMAGEWEVICQARSLVNWEANARLIAAAPDLLSACKCAQGGLRSIGDVIRYDALKDMLERAIAKAEGQE